MTSGRPLRIALTADPELPVPPRLYGGIERIVDLLAMGLSERGHSVTLFAHPDSTCAVRRVAWPGASSHSRSHTLKNTLALASAVVAGGFDVIHSFSRLSYLAPLLPLQVPKLMCYQRPISPRTTSLAQRLSRGTLQFCAISHWMMEHVAHIGTWHMVPNGVKLDTYNFVDRVLDDAPLVFLGRLEAIKGPHIAIEIARRVGRPLILAGNVPAEHRSWFDGFVAPHVDGVNVRYVGPVDDAQKNAILGSAAAFLMPILWDEPFGIVMAEAMACGTPVFGLRRGAVTEVVDHGVTGFVADSVEELIAALGSIGIYSRSACRQRVELLYSERAVVEGYIAVYGAMLRESGRGGAL